MLRFYYDKHDPTLNHSISGAGSPSTEKVMNPLVPSEVACLSLGLTSLGFFPPLGFRGVLTVSSQSLYWGYQTWLRKYDQGHLLK